MWCCQENWTYSFIKFLSFDAFSMHKYLVDETLEEEDVHTVMRHAVLFNPTQKCDKMEILTNYTKYMAINKEISVVSPQTSVIFIQTWTYTHTQHT